MIPLWLDPTPALRQFTEGMSCFPSRVKSEAEEFRLARLESDEMQRLERAARNTVKSKAASEGGKKTAELMRKRCVEDMLKRGETWLQRKKRQNREAYLRGRAKLGKIPKL